jgi:hypothetical protein
MVGLDQEKGRYRVLLARIGGNTEEEKDSFCHNISENYNIPLPLLRRIVDRCPIILKKNLSLKKAEILARTLKAFGATVSVEGKRALPFPSLEFQELVPHQLALESSTPRKMRQGTWMVIGRVRNISDETLNDTWVLIQLFDDSDEFTTFEEAPLTINPLPSGEASPFKVVFELDFSIKRISVAFKNASGQPIPAVDRRRRREWEEVEMKDGDERLRFSPFASPGGEAESSSFDLPQSSEDILIQESSGIPDIPKDSFLPAEPEIGSLSIEEGGEEREEAAGEPLSLTFEEASSEMTSEPSERVLELSSGLTMENRYQEGEGLVNGFEDEAVQALTPPVSEVLEEGTDGDLEPGSDHKGDAEKTHLNTSVFKETSELLEDISELAGKDEVEEVRGEREQKEPPPFLWVDSFREVVENFYQKPRDIFSIWFEEYRKEGEFKDSLHALLTILVHSRFDQGDHSIKALENTQRVFRMVTQPNLLLEDIPSLEGTPFVSSEGWRDLFHRALPKVQQIGKAVLEKSKWSAADLERLMQVIPHMGHQNSRMGLRWINELIPDIVEVDFSDAPVSVGESLYRVASRLGIVDPHFDYFQGSHSMGDIKIQSFAKMVFPQNPIKIEQPMARMGMEEEQGGHCFPTQPQCEGCLFETFCPRCYIHFNPSEKGMRE